MARPGQLNLFTGRVRGPPTPLEFKLHCMVADVLRRWLTEGWVYTHVPNGELRSKSTGARLKRMGLIPGWPDFILLSDDGHPHFLELKRKGMSLSENQYVFAEWACDRGLPYAVCDNFDAALGQLKTWGAVITSVRAA
ncbi:MAG: VRR-NUC domain-containing protein [Rhizobiales bacterium]|nr:VRR-NUC domain-containing protein [Hyphomicrobiales bacterium]